MYRYQYRGGEFRVIRNVNVFSLNTRTGFLTINVGQSADR